MTQTELELVDLEVAESRYYMNKEIVSDDEYEEFLKFIEEYESEKKRKQENSLLMWIYNKIKK